MLRDKMISDWAKVELNSSRGQRQFLEAVEHFLRKPERLARRIRAKAQEFTVASDFPQNAVDAIAKFHQIDEPDLGWEQVFEVIDFTQSNKNGFEILDVGSGLSFRAIKPGEKAEVYKVSGEVIQVSFDLYGGALGWSKVWFDDQEYWKIEDTAREFRAKWYANKAQAHYDLLSASRPDNDVSWQGSANDTKAVRDAETINYACAEILSDLSGLGYEVSPSAGFVIVAPVQLWARLRNALNISAQNNSESQINFNVSLAVTTRLKNQGLTQADTTHYLVCLPGRKLKSGLRMDLTILSEPDILAYAETVAGWGRYGAAVGEVKQLRRCAIS
jgi:hypothetical protein